MVGLVLYLSPSIIELRRVIYSGQRSRIGDRYAFKEGYTMLEQVDLKQVLKRKRDEKYAESYITTALHLNPGSVSGHNGVRHPTLLQVVAE